MSEVTDTDTPLTWVRVYQLFMKANTTNSADDWAAYSEAYDMYCEQVWWDQRYEAYRDE